MLVRNRAALAQIDVGELCPPLSGNLKHKMLQDPHKFKEDALCLKPLLFYAEPGS
jgi:hypothetical protein